MKKASVIALLCATALLCGCGSGNSSSNATTTADGKTSAETTTASETSSAETTAADTTELAEKTELPELRCSASMTDKEKSNTGYRDFTLIYPEKAKKFGDNRSTWEFSAGEVKNIENNIYELKIYDEQLDTNFLVHITLPPGYDENREYPVFFMTDAVWWFGAVPDMWNSIRDGKASPVIFVTLGYDYDTNGTDNNERVGRFVVYQDKLLDFITNDLMGTISGNYKIDTKRSTFFGHSCGGLFSHYALFNSDRYDTQYFADYIIGSPAFWDYYLVNELDSSILPEPDAYTKEFGYFERNEKLDKSVYICAGGAEDPQYEKYYNGHESTLEGVRSLCDRLNSRSVRSVESCIYNNKYHVNYVKPMLKEYLEQHYPAEN